MSLFHFCFVSRVFISCLLTVNCSNSVLWQQEEEQHESMENMCCSFCPVVTSRQYLAVDLSLSKLPPVSRSLHTKHVFLSPSVPLYFQSENFPLTPRPPVGCRSSSQLLPVTAVRTTAGSLRLSPEAGVSYSRKSVCVCVWDHLSVATCQHAHIMQVTVCYFRSYSSQLNGSGLCIPMCVTGPCVDAFILSALRVFALQLQMWSFNDVYRVKAAVLAELRSLVQLLQHQ